jgi:hypothetical protein
MPPLHYWPPDICHFAEGYADIFTSLRRFSCQLFIFISPAAISPPLIFRHYASYFINTAEFQFSLFSH